MFSLAIKDFKEALSRWHLWCYLAWSDIRLRYRRSSLGPWWITISMAIFVGAMSVVYSRLFRQDMFSYLPFLVCGMLIWTFISSSVIDGAMIFRNNQALVKQIKLPYFIHPFKNILTNIIILAHNFVVYLVLLFICKIQLHWNILLVIPGFFLVALNMLWVNLLVGMIGTRFRDIPPIINSLVQVTFFISPITWMSKLVGESSLIVKLNPLVYLMDVVRSPLLGQTPNIQSWYVVSGICLMGCAFTFITFAKYRRRIPFWVD